MPETKPKTAAALVLPPAPVPLVAVAGTEARFPVRRIFCVGRNYAAHAREMERDPDREPPFFFLKRADTVVDDGSEIPYPPETAKLHYQIELVVAIAKGDRDIPPERALDHAFGYAVGIDNYYSRGKLASNETLVERTARIARELLGLKPVSAGGRS